MTQSECRTAKDVAHATRASVPRLRRASHARSRALNARRSAGPTALAGPWDWGPSLYGACPLCGRGEAGAEHLLLWCPAVALAWAVLSGGDGTLASAVATPGQLTYHQAIERKGLGPEPMPATRHPGLRPAALRQH